MTGRYASSMENPELLCKTAVHGLQNAGRRPWCMVPGGSRTCAPAFLSFLSWLPKLCLVARKRPASSYFRFAATEPLCPSPHPSLASAWYSLGMCKIAISRLASVVSSHRTGGCVGDNASRRFPAGQGFLSGSVGCQQHTRSLQDSSRFRLAIAQFCSPGGTASKLKAGMSSVGSKATERAVTAACPSSPKGASSSTRDPNSHEEMPLNDGSNHSGVSSSEGMNFLSSLQCYRRAFDKVVITDSLERVVNSAVKVNMSGAQLIHTILYNKGVRYAFGFTGGAVLPLVDQFYNSDISLYTSAHEQCVGHAAAAVGKSTGYPGVVVVTSGPGLTNLITPLQDAFMDGVPMIVISGQVSTSVMGTDAFQECPATALTKPCTKWNFLAQDVESLPWAMENAFRIAMCGRKGPVHIDCPKNVLVGTADFPLSYVYSSSEGQRGVPHDLGTSAAARDNAKLFFSEGIIRTIAYMINNSKRPILYVGHGAVDAWQSVSELAVKAQIPVTTTVHGVGIFDEFHPLSLHMLGMHGAAYANYAVQHADLVLAVGSRFDDRTTGLLSRYAPAAREAEAHGEGGIVHFDIDRRQVGKVVNPTESVVADCRVSLEHLLPHVHEVSKAQTKLPQGTADTVPLPHDVGESGWRLPIEALHARLEWVEKVTKWKRDFPFQWDKDRTGRIKVQDVCVAINDSLNRKRRTRNLDTTTATGETPVVPEELQKRLTEAADLISESQNNLEVRKPPACDRQFFVCTGVGNHQMMCAQFIRWTHPRQLITSGGLGVMGTGLPFAVGVQVANPSALVILIDGDGSFNMTLNDLQTVSHYNLPVKIAVMNDGNLQMVRIWQELFFEKRYKGTRSHNPDYSMLADSYGIASRVCERREDLGEVVEEWLNSEGPMLVDFRVVSDICLPMVEPGKALDEMLLSRDEVEHSTVGGVAPS